MTKKEYQVQGVHCMNCVQTILEATKELKGLEEITILPDGAMSVVVSEEFDEKELQEVLGEEGFKLEV